MGLLCVCRYVCVCVRTLCACMCLPVYVCMGVHGCAWVCMSVHGCLEVSDLGQPEDM